MCVYARAVTYRDASGLVLNVSDLKQNKTDFSLKKSAPA